MFFEKEKKKRVHGESKPHSVSQPMKSRLECITVLWRAAPPLKIRARLTLLGHEIFKGKGGLPFQAGTFCLKNRPGTFTRHRTTNVNRLLAEASLHRAPALSTTTIYIHWYVSLGKMYGLNIWCTECQWLAHRDN